MNIRRNSMKNILVVSGHTDLNNSFANKTILERLTELLPEAVYVYLDREYPGYSFDVPKEQQRLMDADVIVLQFPFFWYSVPSIMKKWIEDVFVHGFSHGSTGDKLHGKQLLLSFTSGAPEELYRKGALQNWPIEDFLVPLHQLANLCGLQWLGVVYSGGMAYTNRQDPANRAAMREKALAHAERLAERLRSL